jgi:guanylate kinase
VIKQRLDLGKSEIEHWREYDYIIVTRTSTGRTPTSATSTAPSA